MGYGGFGGEYCRQHSDDSYYDEKRESYKEPKYEEPQYIPFWEKKEESRLPSYTEGYCPHCNSYGIAVNFCTVCGRKLK